jgi:PHP family Zn ribbon phosphoesterase
MNWRVSALDRVALISNSDAHSPEKLAREANVLDIELSYDALFEAFRARDPRRFLSTIEFFPEEGKYHLDGHRDCGERLMPRQTRDNAGRCGVCGKGVTVGVLHRVEALADRPEGYRPRRTVPFENVIPLKEVIGETLGVGPASVAVNRQYMDLLERYGSELSILRTLSTERLERDGFRALATALARMRRGDVRIEPGYDGEYGVISLASAEAAV